MMEHVWYYLSIFRRKLPYFLIVATGISAVAVTVAYTLPPAYVSRMVLLIEAPQIPEELASSTVNVSAFEQLQVLQQRLLVRDNLLDIARELQVLPDIDKMNPDEIVAAMRARTTVRASTGGRNQAPLMTMTFEAPNPRAAAGVLNEYLILIQQQDSQFRRGRAGETLEFFEQEAQRLAEDLDTQSAQILAFKQANADALPDSLEFRLGQQALFQERLLQTDRDVSDLSNQKDRLIQLYDVTGEVNANREVPLSPDQVQLAELQAELNAALIVYSEENPRVRLLQARIDQLEEKLAATAGAGSEAEPAEDADPDLPAVLTLQLSEIDTRIDILLDQKTTLQAQLEELDNSIARTPEVAIQLEEMDRKYASIEQQYNTAEDRLARARTGDRIETRARGQRLVVIEQPAIPSQPTKPNRMRIAGAGVFMGIAAGLGLIFLLEFLNNTARRPEDIINRFGVTPLTTIPYIRTRGQRFRQRSLQVLFILVILIGVPAAVYAVHTYYLPLDLIADKVMNRLGVRW